MMSNLLELRKRHVQDQSQLEGVVEGEPVDGVDGALEHGQEAEADPVLPFRQSPVTNPGPSVRARATR